MYSAAWVNQFEMKDKCFKFVINVSRQGSNVNPIQDWLFWGYLRMRWRGGGKRPPLPKICRTYPAMMKLGTAIPYPKKIQKIYESRDTPLEFC